jgi:hypothetical protein
MRCQKAPNSMVMPTGMLLAAGFVLLSSAPWMDWSATAR